MVSTSTLLLKLDTIVISVQEMASCDASSCNQMRLKSGQVREYVQFIRGQCVQRLNRLAADVGQTCCGNLGTVLNDVALSDAHKLRDQTITFVML